MNPFLGLFFGFSHIGKIQDGRHSKYKRAIVSDLMVVESYENTLLRVFEGDESISEVIFWI